MTTPLRRRRGPPPGPAEGIDTMATPAGRTHHPARMIPGLTWLTTVGSGCTRRMGPMSNGENRRNGPQFRTAPLITSAAMVGGGTLIALTGLAVGGGHLLSATRQWINEMEVPPSEVARLKWTQARAAMAAGAAAWQNGTQRQSSPAIPANG